MEDAHPSSLSESTTTTAATDTTTPLPSSVASKDTIVMSLSDPIIKKSLHRISTHPTLTPYRRRVYRVLLSVPPGSWTTYSALAHYLGSSARAVGNAMRTNPFAPDVPCHRVLAKDGGLGGYKGEWERAAKGKKKGAVVGEGRCRGRSRQEKIDLLVSEGVAFDEEEKARGRCFIEFVELGV